MVMYRDFAQRKARGLRLVGEVQNLKDGTVRVVAEGPRANLEVYVEKLKKGPLHARVESVSFDFGEAAGGYTDFSIRYD
jgi:acylphosphatase